MPNKYVNFVSDEHFLECVKHVCESYQEVASTELDDLSSNGIDPFKIIFDIENKRISFSEWLKKEALRQEDKTVNNTLGEFHQMLLGKVRGWTDLGIGDDSHLDLRKNDNTIFIELKNKENTLNADSKNQVREKLKAAITMYPTAIAYWAYIIKKDNTSGERIWKYRGDANPKIKVTWGSKVYELITGDPDALEKVWKVLPKAIAEVLGNGIGIPSQDLQKISEFFQNTFH